MSADERSRKICIYPGCERPAVPPHLLGGPQPSFCDLEAHNALTAHQERRRRAPGAPAGAGESLESGSQAGPANPHTPRRS